MILESSIVYTFYNAREQGADERLLQKEKVSPWLKL